MGKATITNDQTKRVEYYLRLLEDLNQKIYLDHQPGGKLRFRSKSYVKRDLIPRLESLILDASALLSLSSMENLDL